MESFLLPAAAAIIVFMAFLMLPQFFSDDEDRRKRALRALSSDDSQGPSLQSMNEAGLLKETGEKSLFKSLANVPGMGSTYDLLLKSGFANKIGVFLLGVLLLFFASVFMLHKLKILGFFIALVITWFAPRAYLKGRIAKRNRQFLDLFPDAIDMIVRSVRSGHPLNTAMRIIAENMDNPVREEFKQVVDEISLGRSLSETLARLAQRIDEPDLQFFVVVLSVQQETGGSLAEVLSNLSSIIRKRKQLRLKIRALTSEGRATSYILGALPIVEFGALYYVTPHYLDPLFESTLGNILLGISASLIIGAIWIVRIMVNVEV